MAHLRISSSTTRSARNRHEIELQSRELALLLGRAAALGEYLGRNVQAFISAVKSGAAGVYMATVDQDVLFSSQLVTSTGQNVHITSARRGITWNGDLFLTEGSMLSLTSVILLGSLGSEGEDVHLKNVQLGASTSGGSNSITLSNGMAYLDSSTGEHVSIRMNADVLYVVNSSFELPSSYFLTSTTTTRPWYSSCERSNPRDGTEWGVGIELAAGTTYVQASRFVGLCADSDDRSGAITVSHIAILHVDDCVFANNQGLGGAGAIYVGQARTLPIASSLHISNSQFLGNAGAIGGAIAAVGFSTVTMAGTVFTGNLGTAQSSNVVNAPKGPEVIFWCGDQSDCDVVGLHCCTTGLAVLSNGEANLAQPIGHSSGEGRRLNLKTDDFFEATQVIRSSTS